MPRIPCECGCGTLIRPITRKFKPARFAQGHNSGGEATRFKSKGDQRMKAGPGRLTLGEYRAMHEAQGHRCAVCGKHETHLTRDGRPRSLSVDHDHRCCPDYQKTCGQCNRGLVCARCNMVLGLVRDDEQLLRQLADYLARTRAPTRSSVTVLHAARAEVMPYVVDCS